MRLLTLGILTDGKGPVPGNREMFRFVMNACETAGISACVFKPFSINWAKGTLKGYSYRRGNWRGADYSLPLVVYNRVPNRALESAPPVQGVLRRLRQKGIPYYNACFLNKYDLYRLLSRDGSIEPFLPWTDILQKEVQMSEALTRFHSIYLKPKYAFAGRGIMKVSQGQNRWLLSLRRGGKNLQMELATRGELLRTLRQQLGQQVYIIQQAIPLARYRRRIFDSRLLVQKDGEGKWQLSGFGVRVAGAGGITTHVPNGGFIAPAEQVFRAVFPGRHSEVMNGIKALALAVAPVVDGGYRGLFGELSMDIGVDEGGHPWFFEANAKPMRFDEPRIRQAGLASLTAYVGYLARQGSVPLISRQSPQKN